MMYRGNGDIVNRKPFNCGQIHYFIRRDVSFELGVCGDLKARAGALYGTSANGQGAER